MTIDELLQDKTIKPKEKTETISKWILDKSLPIDALIAFAEKQKDPAKATSIEAIEYATKQNPKIADEKKTVFHEQTERFIFIQNLWDVVMEMTPFAS